MNRTQRRADRKRSPAGSRLGEAADLLAQATEHHRRRDLTMALKLYGKLLDLTPTNALAHERVAMIYGAQGLLKDASDRYAALARLAPQTLTDFDKVVATLRHLIPTLNAALAAPHKASIASLLAVPAEAKDKATSMAANPYLQAVLALTLVRDVALEHWLTALRGVLLRAALADEAIECLDFCGALARQCFINEYVFSVAADEAPEVERLRDGVKADLAEGRPVDPTRLVVLAMYMPLHALPGAPGLGTQTWPTAVEAVVTQQVREPQREQELRATIPRLTDINDGITAQVRQQYEENPYPRWVLLPQPPDPLMVIDDHLRYQFPSTPFRPTGARDSVEVLVAGCGTGRFALEVAQTLRGARVLAVDLSLSSLSHAKRKIPDALAGRIEFAQADILKLGSLGRTFDIINVAGVLHHMEDALGGWRALIKLMKPNGVMQVGLYSAHARRDIVAARKLIAERGYAATPEGIRQCRRDLRNGPEQFKFMGLRDFYSISECRDLMFHVHERRFTIPEIKDFLDANGLNFIGFEFTPQDAHAHHHGIFAAAGWPAADLDRWDAYERANPDIFASMYKFWVQKTDAAPAAAISRNGIQ